MPDSNRAFENLAFDKENFQSWVAEDMSIPVSDEQWERIKDELDGRVENYLDQMIYDVVLEFREGAFDE
jgi:hypothetical protein